ncbi:MAG: AhpC/TSA family protein [Bacteroidaceae bacterium]|nr:AhpC/TSA family protein [Bacteroidaceae bacterium]
METNSTTSKFFMWFIATLFFVSCNKQVGHFHITGNITEAKDTMLYLEHLTLGDGIVVIDSILLDEKGDFKLSGPRPDNPEFYRLRIGRKVINLSIDSTETVSVTATLPTMTHGYRVEGSGNCDTIRLLNLKLINLNNHIQRVADDRSLTLSEREDSIEALIQNYKKEVKINYIQNHYGSAASYYAMFQMTNGQMVFNPVNDPSDITWFAAIANSWETLYPNSPRTENLRNIVLQGRRNTQKRILEIDMDNEKVSETGLVDMAFPDASGNTQRLSDLKGHVVLLDFTSYSLPVMQERTLALRELYNCYHSQGLEIYQVSLDESEHFWKTMTAQLPWICVWNSEGLDNDIVRIYNLQTLPTWFLINRQNNLVGRQELLDDLETEIQKLL